MLRALTDTAAVLSAAASIARRAAAATAGEQAAAGPRGPFYQQHAQQPQDDDGEHPSPAKRPASRPWPTHVRAQETAQAGEHVDANYSTAGPSSAPLTGDDAPAQANTPKTQVHIANMHALSPELGKEALKASQSKDGGRSLEEVTRDLDASLGAYLAPEPSAPEPRQGAETGASTLLKDNKGSFSAATAPQPTEAPKETAIPHAEPSPSIQEAAAAPSPAPTTAAETPVEPQQSVNNSSSAPTSPFSSQPVPPSSASSTAPPSTAQPKAPVSQGEEYDAATEVRSTPLRAAKVPSSRIGRLLHYGGLGAGLAWGAAGEYMRRGTAGGAGRIEGASEQGKQSVFMSEQNVARLVDKLSTMRGAALKLGQFMSIQDSNMLPEQIEQIMLRVQNSAHYMPAWQMEKVMREDLGEDWRSHFSSFDDVPFASASIGQVHSATISPSHPSPLAGQRVCVKIQFPGVAESISSDLSNLRWLVTASALLPRGLFLDNTIRVMRRELADECDYVREAEMVRRFGELLDDSEVFAVPKVVGELCSRRVLTTEMMRGRPLTHAARFSQDKRDQIAKSILELSLRELFDWRLMQTDPNWTNFLYNERTGKIELIDFGATREYSKSFMDDWLRILRAAVAGDREACVKWSRKVGYLTGEESTAMRDAHVESMIALGEPFRASAPDPYPFAEQTITERVRAQIPLMLRERLTPPPEETYSLNRKLSGAFLLCARLKAHVSCATMLQHVTRGYVIDAEASDGPASAVAGSSAAAFGTGKRGLHTSRILTREASSASAGKKAPSLGDEIRKVRLRSERRGRNLGDRWPRNIVSATQGLSSDDGAGAGASGDKYETLSAPPVSPSMSGTPSDAGSDSATTKYPRQAEPTPAEESSPAENPMTARTDSMSEDAKKEENEKEIWIRGTRVPLKPPPPGPEDCCMSGCAHCIYDIYTDELRDWHSEMSDARSSLLALSPPLSDKEWRSDVLGERPIAEAGEARQNESQGKGERETPEEHAEREVERIIGNLDPSMKAFLEMERKMKAKKKAQ